jgi:hypothetical protein
VTKYNYGDAWGNLTQVTQDPGSSPHVNAGGNKVSYCQTDIFVDLNPQQTRSHNRIAEIQNKFFNKNQYGQWQSIVLTQNDYTYNSAGMRTANQISDVNGVVRTETYTFDLRHEAVRMIVMRSRFRHDRVSHHPYPTRKPYGPYGIESPRTTYPVPQYCGSVQTARRGRGCQHRAARGKGGPFGSAQGRLMANTSELSFKRRDVRTGQRVLRGRSQNGNAELEDGTVLCCSYSHELMAYDAKCRRGKQIAAAELSIAQNLLFLLGAVLAK